MYSPRATWQAGETIQESDSLLKSTKQCIQQLYSNILILFFIPTHVFSQTEKENLWKNCYKPYILGEGSGGRMQESHNIFTILIKCGLMFILKTHLHSHDYTDTLNCF